MTETRFFEFPLSTHRRQYVTGFNGLYRDAS